jgi:hypothetical protein
MQKVLKWSFLGHFLKPATGGKVGEKGSKNGPKNRYFGLYSKMDPKMALFLDIKLDKFPWVLRDLRTKNDRF